MVRRAHDIPSSLALLKYKTIRMRSGPRTANDNALALIGFNKKD